MCLQITFEMFTYHYFTLRIQHGVQHIFSVWKLDINAFDQVKCSLYIFITGVRKHIRMIRLSYRFNLCDFLCRKVITT